MGNTLVGNAPTEIFPVEHYLTGLPGIQFDKSLGSTRFLKVARAKSQEGLIVVKVFTINDCSLPLSSHKNRIEELRNVLALVFNCLPFQRVVITEKACMIMRGYVKYSLYDRISTRPFLSNIEKRWITFQILYALHQCHKVGICHGDIKLENICVTSWNWVLLVDFASFKPPFIPEDNPADYSYFFDTSRRRTCYIAPERFVQGQGDLLFGRERDGASKKDVKDGKDSKDGKDKDESMKALIAEAICKHNELQPAMDIFSTGCALLELWNEGHPPFDLSQLLAYKAGVYAPTKHLDALSDTALRAMLESMLQKNPAKRLTAESYLNKERGKFFPEYFYSFLQSYMLFFSASPILPPDEKIARLRKDISNIINILKTPEATAENDGLVIVIALVTSCVRGLHHCTSKLQCLDILAELAANTTSEIILDRILPFIVYLCHDQWSRVRASAIQTLTNCLAMIKKVPRSDVNVFPEYILPGISNLSTDHSLHVRRALAENVAILAETALRFLEQSCIECEFQGPRINYELELQTLHEMFQQIVSCMLTDSNSIVRQTLMENNITKLCIFFGKQKANDIVLSHMITFLNDKEDTELRLSFFDCIIGVATFVGWQCSSILTPLLLQGLTDRSEFVTAKCINAMSALAELGLIKPSELCELFGETITLGLVHPSTWIRLTTAGFVASAAKALGPLDTHCKLAPMINDYLAYPLIQIDKPELLLQALVPPIPRTWFDNLTNYEQSIEVLESRSQARQALQTGQHPTTVGMTPTLKNVFRRMDEEGLNEIIEDRILKMKNHIRKIHEYKKKIEKKPKVDGRLDLQSSMSHKADLASQTRKLHKGVSSSATETTMNTEWQHMFGEENTEKISIERTNSLTESPTIPDAGLQLDVNGSSSMSAHERSYIQYGVAECRIALRSLESLRQTRYAASTKNRERAERAAWRTPVPPPGWRCRGSLVAHLHEHKAAITRLVPLGIGAGATSTTSVATAGMFASAGLDGCVRLWDCKKMEGRNIANRSKYIYQTNTGGIMNMATTEGEQSLCIVGRDGSLQTLRLEKPTSGPLPHPKPILEPGSGVLDVCSIGGNMIAVTTLSGDILAFDLRKPGPAWKLNVPLKDGVPSAMCVDTMHYCWLAVGTISGKHIVWDLRFGIPIAQISHPSDSQVRRLTSHPTEHSWLISSTRQNNEITMWNLETSSRQVVLWASPAPPLSINKESQHVSFGQPNVHSVFGLRAGRVDRSSFLLAAGTDQRVRYWDLDAPHESYIAVPSPKDVCAPVYKNRVIDGINVVQEIWSGGQSNPAGGMPSAPIDDPSNSTGRAGPEPPTSGHKTPITDIILCQAGQCFVVAGGSDGLVTVWK